MTPSPSESTTQDACTTSLPKVGIVPNRLPPQVLVMVPPLMMVAKLLMVL
jgi:hypothetical protein